MTASEPHRTIRPMLTHAGIWVRDINAMESSCTGVLSFEATDKGFVPRYNGQIEFMSNDPEIHHQLILAQGRPADSPSTVNQLSFEVRSLDDLRAMYKRISDAECENLLPRNLGNTWSVYFDDPEGNNLEVYLDSPFHVPQPFGE